MPRDWTGNSQAVYSTLAASNHSQTDREDYDYYATPPKAVEELLSREQLLAVEVKSDMRQLLGLIQWLNHIVS